MRQIAAGRGAALACAIIAFIGLSLLWGTFAVHTASNWYSFPRFVLAVVVLFVLPGDALLRWWRLPLTPLEHLTLATCLGIILTCIAYAVAEWGGRPDLLWILLSASVGAALFGLRHRRPIALSPRGEHALLLLTLVATWLPILAIRFYGPNLSFTNDGGMVFAKMRDVLFHAAVAGELTHTLPPQVPYFSGTTLSYHFGMDLVAAVLARFGGLSIADLVTRLCPLLFVTIDVLALFCLGRRYFGSGKAGVALAFLTLLGTDFAFIFGLLQGNPNFWDSYYYSVPTIFSLYFSNPMAMGLGFLFAGLFCLLRAMAERRTAWFLATSLCFVALLEIKVFLFLQLGMALATVAILELALFKRQTCMRLGICVLLLSLPLALLVLRKNGSGGDIAWTYASGMANYVKPAIARMHLPAFAAIWALALPIFIFCAFGFRIVGIVAFFKALKPTRDHSFASLLAIFVLLGPILTLTSKIVPRDDPSGYDNAVWFLCASKFVATIFAIAALKHLWTRLGRFPRYALAALVLVTSVPSSIQYVWKATRDWPMQRWDHSQVSAILALDRVAAPGQVVLSATPGFDPLIMAMTTLREPYAESMFEGTLIGKQALAARERDVHSFQRSWGEGVLETAVLDRYGVTWIIAPHSVDAAWTSSDLEQIFDNGALTIYRVRNLAAEPRD